ncbi:YggS family pyridoxal phosphate-dependent enzyme [Thermus antranikianii]|uniref:Pyridoxal phosphate homeostasis protein n=1 Tax=Thermus antranikianii TaxID=88190 RepID=A0ABY7RQN5_9DEIN|nr:YggS family pyridoxal phosphate-dependent enzyme [Thermus antranikianii]QWK21159.1 MAG: YggS family pyridoxal phosphate-dependent enzyme [Thermus antranikianii]WCM40012.1 YggS family pyridoxal phosphate-dependent enzyme [Thermus antranikianii]
MGLPEVLEAMEAACRRAGRDPREVRLVAVTKGRSVEEIREKVLRYGSFPLGESRVQEALKKMELLGAEWHLVGPLQRNKAKFAPRFALIHSLDSLRLAEALDRVGEKQGVKLRVLVEVNLGREPQKHGFLEEELPEALARVREMAHLEVLGLMTVPPMGPEAVVRPIFRRLSELADRYGLPERSMGMSDDFPIAIEEGATMVRVGRALFVD